MKTNGIKFGKYFKEYRLSDVLAMIKNNSKRPLICSDACKGKLVVITGATSGIGYAVARKFASKGADLICINRNKERSEALKHEIESVNKVKCDYILADFSSMDDTDKAAHSLLELEKPIDIIIHNAGIYLTKRQITSNGIEKVFMVNYLSSFIMNYILKEKLISQGKCRIILVNSEGHRFAAWGMRFDDLDWSKRHYSGLKSYGTAKLAELLAMIKFDEYFRGSGVTINAMHPGAVKTATGQDNGPLYKWFKKNVLDKALQPVSVAAEAIYYLGVSEDLDTCSGEFFNLTTLEEPAPPALDIENAKVLWEISLKMGNLNE
ncbi:SDR family NAD(P)-dependent oxidoreductase [Trichococcus ilyis]|uniref:Glucose/ribitol dehydrogenase n=1 Tax=Trichococcus ilyis TaxID=640938 RepID=A0A143YE87_9LACT|nr:SDR family NAD(P)-dependent oxidoreductase [Trichococcus ilyis]CZQ84827.1 glucose/ribitol dehydrogenase [Trichococcus ilyis]SEJ61656.1 Short-chain dehydrogenase [Trichococcus ilyis]